MQLLSDMFTFISENWSAFLLALGEHLLLSVSALFLAVCLSVPLGIFGARNHLFASYGIGFFNGLRVIPSLSILVLFLPLLGLGFLPALLALTFLAIPPILLATYTGIREISPDVLEAATGIGMGPRLILRKIELPLAFPLILSGIRTAAIEVIASASLAAYIGAGGLGQYIIMGLGLYNISIMLVGAIPIASLAIVCQLVFLTIEKHRQSKN